MNEPTNEPTKKPVFKAAGTIALSLQQCDTILAALQRHRDVLGRRAADEAGLARLASCHGAPLSSAEVGQLMETLHHRIIKK